MAAEARQLCLYIATILGDLLEDIVVVGGLVPYLIIDQHAVANPHVGTRDLDLGLSLALLDQERYRDISARLRSRGFEAGTKTEGQMTRQTWVLPATRVTIDFLIPSSERGPAAGSLQNLEGDFAAIVTPALPVAFRDHVSVTIDDSTTAGERAKRTVNVCGPAAFVVLKAHAMRGRGENKDAYDLVYVLMNYGHGSMAEVVEAFAKIADEDVSKEALGFLAEDFESPDHVGPARAAEFTTGRQDSAIQTDAFGYVQDFLTQVEQVLKTAP